MILALTLLQRIAVAGLEIVALLLFLALLLALFVGGILKDGQKEWEEKNADAATVTVIPATVIEPQDLMDEPQCSWCEFERVVRSRPYDPKASHGICRRHQQMMIEQSKHFPKSQFA